MLAAASLLMFASRKHAEQLLQYFTRMADEHNYTSLTTAYPARPNGSR